MIVSLLRMFLGVFVQLIGGKIFNTNDNKLISNFLSIITPFETFRCFPSAFPPTSPTTAFPVIFR